MEFDLHLYQVNKYPWLVRIFKRQGNRYLGAGFCGGTLIAAKFVITAGHCVYNRKECPSGQQKCPEIYTSKLSPSKLAVRIGDHNIAKTGEEFLTRKNVHVKAIHKHHKWVEPKIPGPMLSDGYDVAILELAEVLDLAMYTPACLPRSSDATTFDGKKATAVGWGQSYEGRYANSYSPTPQEVVLTVISKTDSRCSKENKNPSRMCAGLDESGKGGCHVSFFIVNIIHITLHFRSQGDSGGPFTHKQGSQHILIGVLTSASGEGFTPGRIGSPPVKNECGFKTGLCRVSGVRDWIDTILSGAIVCKHGVTAG